MRTPVPKCWHRNTSATGQPRCLLTSTTQGRVPHTYVSLPPARGVPPRHEREGAGQTAQHEDEEQREHVYAGIVGAAPVGAALGPAVTASGELVEQSFGRHIGPREGPRIGDCSGAVSHPLALPGRSGGSHERRKERLTSVTKLGACHCTRQRGYRTMVPKL